MNNTPQDNDQGSFLTGFGLGLFAGAAGYFLFATKKGKKVQAELTREWEVAKKSFQQTADSEAATGVNLRQILINTANSFFDLDDTKDKKSASEKSPKRARRKKTAQSSSSAKKFKGV